MGITRCKIRQIARAEKAPRDARAGRVVFRRGPEYVDDESGELALEQLNAADTLLMGRNTYEIDAGAWPDRHGALSDQ